MKILFVFGGIPLYMDGLLKTLASKGVEVAAVIPEKGSVSFGKGVKTTGEGSGPYKIIRSPEKRSRLGGKAFYPGLKEILASERPDIFVIGWPYMLQLWFRRGVLRFARKNGIKVMLREIPYQVPPYMASREYFRENPVYDEDMRLRSRGPAFRLRNRLVMHIRRFLYRRADGALGYATHAYDIIPSYGIAREKIFVTYNSTDTRALDRALAEVKRLPRLLPENNHRIIHIGRLVKRKRVDLLIEAFSEITKHVPDAEAVLVGEGPELENLMRRARELGVADRMTFTGGVYDPVELGRYMYESSVYVLTGMGGLSFNDAMTFSLPVICPDKGCDGTERDLLEEGFNGFFFREGDAASLAEKVVAIFSGDGLAGAMGRNARKVIDEKINIDTVAERYIAAFKTVLG